MKIREHSALAIARGTTLITLAVPDGVAMAADDLVYELQQDGEAVPSERGVRKVYAMGSVLIGSSGMMRCSCGGKLVREGDVTQEVSIEYKFEDWIVDFIRANRGTDSSPKIIADGLYEKMRGTFRPVEIMLQCGGWWSDYNPGDRLMNYLIAGFAGNYKNLQLFETGAEYADGHRLQYIEPRLHETSSAWAMGLPKDVYFGEDEFFLKALDGIEPQYGISQREASKCLVGIETQFPGMPKALQEVASNAIALVKVEGEFNPKKVGSTVNAGILDRVAKRHYLATF